VTLRDQLLTELDALTTPEAATSWAHHILGRKNSLTTADAQRIEEVQTKAPLSPTRTNQTSAPKKPPSVRTRKQNGANGIDKSLLAVPEPRRIRDKEHTRFVAKQPCLICGRQPSDAHHLRFAQHRALGRKVSDEFTVPLCRGHHREVHRCGDEAQWWNKAGVDPAVKARALWLKTHPLPIASTKQSEIASVAGAMTAADKRSARHDRPLGNGGPNDETNPIIAAGPR
jgi:hypothetical protein